MLMGSPNHKMTCPEPSTGRTAIYPLQSEHARPHHDISLCNIMGMGADYLFVPFQSRLYVVVDPLGLPALALLSILVVGMMVIVGHNLQVVLGDALVSASGNDSQGDANASDRSDYKWTTVGMLTIVACSYFATAFNLGKDGTLAGGLSSCTHA